MKSKYLTIGGLSALSVTFITNFGFADVSSDRLDTYKANKLIPNEVQIATINSVSSESAGVTVFSPDVLSWKSYSNAASAALGKYMDWTREDFEAFFADSANEAEFEDAWNALSQFGNDHVQGAAISDEDSLIVLQNQFDALIDQFSGPDALPFPAFPCEGMDFSGKSLYYLDFSACSGITWEQISKASYFCDVILPSIDFTNVDLSGQTMYSIDISKSIGLTGKQIESLNSISSVKLPSVDLTGIDFSGKTLTAVDLSKCTGFTSSQLLSTNGFSGVILPNMDLSNASFDNMNIMRVDFTRCTGLTAAQLSNASNMNYIKLTSEQYTAMKADLPSGKTIYVDDILTKIP